MPYVRKRKTTPRKPKYSRKIPYKTKGSSKSIVRTIKSVINHQAETKHLNMDPLTYNFVNVPNNNSLMFDAVSLSENFDIPQGNSDGSRVGNSVNITKCILNMNFKASGVASTGPFIVSLYIGYLKPARSSLPGPDQFLQFLQDGSGATTINNHTLSLLRNVNTDLFTITNKARFKLGTAEGGLTNNDFPLFVNKKISIKYLLGKLQFNDAGLSPSKDLYMWCHYMDVRGGAASTAQPTFNYYLDVEYKDF